MALLTGTKHGDAANELMVFYQEEAKKLASSGSYFMVGVALGAALETALLTFILVEWGEDNGGELEIPADVTLDNLIDAASDGNFDLFNAAKFKGPDGDCSVQTVVREIQVTRNNLHAGRCLRKQFNPASFGVAEYERLKAIYGAVRAISCTTFDKPQGTRRITPPSPPAYAPMKCTASAITPCGRQASPIT